MFRPTKKRPRKPTIVRTNDEKAADDDHDESPDETTVKRPSKKKKKKRTPQRPVVMSFDMDVEEDSTTPKKKKGKNKSSGMGFGGAPGIAEEATAVDNEDQDEDMAAQGGESATMYGIDALNKLKSEQRYKPREEPPTSASDAKGVSTCMQPPSDDSHRESSQPVDAALPSFIPLSGKQEEHVILTGDEAIDYETNQTLEPLRTTTEDTVMDAQKAEESSAWEAQLASRAGVVRGDQHPARVAPIGGSTSTNLDKLRTQVKTALTQLQNQTEDVQNATSRRKVEVTHVQEDLSRQESELEQAGMALEYYQLLREQLASWVGALRELRTKVMPLQEALHKVERLGGNRWRDWQDDVISILREANLLDRVLGRQPIQENVQVTTVVDEFGRDVKSQFVLQRDKRVRQRRNIRVRRAVHDEDSDALLSDGERTEMMTRRDALREALMVAMDGVDEEYTQLSNLIGIFAKWASTYPEEYQQCFASMSLADLASVLVQADLCCNHHPLRWQVDGAAENELPWLKDLQSIPVAETTEDEDTPSYRMADKVLIPIFLDILDEGAYNILSKRESRSLSAFYHRICELFPKGNTLTVSLTNRITKYLKDGLDEIAIPILKPLAPKDEPFLIDVEECINYATTGQVRRLVKFVCNILNYWNLNDMAVPTLDFVSSNLVFLLSSLKAHGRHGGGNDDHDLASESFAKVWKALQKTGWLERPELMLQAAPIRAAAVVYDIGYS